MASNRKPEKRDAMSIFGYRGGGDKPRKKEVIQYDKQGNRLGDDGFPMTPTRKRMHKVWDAWFIYVIVMVVAAIALMVLAYFQGAEYTDWEIVQRGGNQFNGWDTAFLIRLEALHCLYTAVISALLSIFGFRWFYDRKPVVVVYAMMLAIAGVGIGYQIFSTTMVGAIEPLSLVNISFILITVLCMQAVNRERPTLRKPKIGRREVK